MDPGAGVVQPGAAGRDPFVRVVAGKRPGPVGVPEQHVLGVELEPAHRLAHRPQRRAPQLGARDVRPHRAQPRPVGQKAPFEDRPARNLVVQDHEERDES